MSLSQDQTHTTGKVMFGNDLENALNKKHPNHNSIPGMLPITASNELDFAHNSHDATINDFVTLTKPGVLILVVFSAVTGIMLAPGTRHVFLTIAATLAIVLGSAAAAVFNMWYDRDIDRIMTRTKKRPLPNLKISPHDALVFGWCLAISSLILMYATAGMPATLMLAFSIFFYVIVYTIILKRSTPQNIVIGGAAGAFPPVIGWLAAGGDFLKPLPWILFMIIFLWTPSHFWALAIFRSRDYALAKVPMLPNTHGLKATKIQIISYALFMAAVSYLFYAFPFNGLTTAKQPSPGFVYFVAATILNSLYLYLAYRLYRTEKQKHSMDLFQYSIFYLFLLFASLIIDFNINL